MTKQATCRNFPPPTALMLIVAAGIGLSLGAAEAMAQQRFSNPPGRTFGLPRLSGSPALQRPRSAVPAQQPLSRPTTGHAFSARVPLSGPPNVSSRPPAQRLRPGLTLRPQTTQRPTLTRPPAIRIPDPPQPRPTVPAPRTVRTFPSNPPQIVPPRLTDSAPRIPRTPVATTPAPLPPTTSRPPQNAMPASPPTVPENDAPAADIRPASRELAREVQKEVGRLKDQETDKLLKLLDDAPAQTGRLGFGEKLDELKQVVKDGVPPEGLGKAVEALTAEHDALADLDDQEFLKWYNQVGESLHAVALLAGIEHKIGGALADAGGGGLFGPLGPGGLLPGGGPAVASPLVSPLWCLGHGWGHWWGHGCWPWFGQGCWAGGHHLGCWSPWWNHFGCWPGWHPHGFCFIQWPWLPQGACYWICGDIFLCGAGGIGGFGVTYGPSAYMGLPVAFVEPVPNALPDVDYFGRIVLLNPEETGGTIHYLLDDGSFALEAGYLQDMQRARTMIRFDRGSGLGEARYTLTPGSYRFVVTDRGWELKKTSFSATIDNTGNAHDFHLLLDREPVTIPARSQQTVNSAYPLLVSFDDGSGNEVVRKSLRNREAYTIGVNRETGRWDLFAGDASASGIGRVNDARTIASLTEPPAAAAGPVSAPRAID